MNELAPAELAGWLSRTRDGETTHSSQPGGPAAADPGAAAPSAQPGAAAPPTPLLLDVREPWEVAIASLPGSVNVPMQQIPAAIGTLDASRPIVCICHHGMRSMQVAWFLERNGFQHVFNLTGGIDGWARDVDPDCPTY